MPRPKHYDEYRGMIEPVPGVFVATGAGVYIVDDEGEVCCWVDSEWAEDPEAVTAMVNAVAIAATMGAAAVRENIKKYGTVLEGLVQRTFDETHGEQVAAAEPPFEYYAYYGDTDKVPVVHVDTPALDEDENGPICRIYLNDEAIYENPPYEGTEDDG